MKFRSLNSEDHYYDKTLNNVPEKISPFYQQKNDLTKIGINLDKNLQKYITYDDNIDKIRAGGSIPASDRGRVWQELSNSDSLHLETLYQQLIHESTPYKQLIQRDIARTFPNSEMFSQESGQKAMERVLHAYSLYDDEINYCQGLAFLVGPLLMNMPEQQAFSVFVRLMETHGMRTMFTQSMEGLHLRLYQFDCLLQEFLPDIHLFFKNHGVHSQMYLSPWFLTLFAYVLPMDLVMRIYDLVFLQGAAIETMMRVALSLLMRLSPHIMSLGDFEDIVTFLSSKKMITDDDCFIQDSLQLCGYVTRTKLEQLQEKYEQKKKKENGYFKVDSSHASSLIEKRRYDDGTLLKSVINKKKTKKMIKNWFGTISSNKSKVSPPEITPPSKPSSPPSILESNSNNNDTMLLHQQIEDLLAALSLVQKENMTLKNDLYEQTTRSKSNAMLESRMKQLSKELQEMTVDRNLQLQEKEEAKHHAHELRKQLDALDKSRAWSTRNSLDGLRRNNSMLSDSSSSSSSYSSNKDDNEVPHLLPSPLTFEKPFSPSIITLRYKSSDII